MIGFLRAEAVDHVGVSDQDEVQPTAAPLPACGHAHLSTPALQQGPGLLEGGGDEAAALRSESYNQTLLGLGCRVQLIQYLILISNRYFDYIWSGGDPSCSSMGTAHVSVFYW